jgi:hypothetical protein
MIRNFEKGFPNRAWVLARHPERVTQYLASSYPKGYVATIPGPHPDIVKAVGDTPEDAFSTMSLKVMRRSFNVKQE